VRRGNCALAGKRLNWRLSPEAAAERALPVGCPTHAQRCCDRARCNGGLGAWQRTDWSAASVFWLPPPFVSASSSLMRAANAALRALGLAGGDPARGEAGALMAFREGGVIIMRWGHRGHMA
jgi:hypothetical protein